MVKHNSGEKEIKSFYDVIIPKISYRNKQSEETLKKIAKEKNFPGKFSHNFESEYWKHFENYKQCSPKSTIAFMMNVHCKPNTSNMDAIEHFSKTLKYFRQKITFKEMMEFLNHCHLNSLNTDLMASRDTS